jgi:predicted nuclease with TOPRIM domain
MSQASEIFESMLFELAATKKELEECKAKLKIATDLATKLEKQLEVCKGQRNDLYERIENMSEKEKSKLIAVCDQELEKVEG